MIPFVAYNTLWDTGYIGQGSRPQPGVWFDREQGWWYWKRDDGSMPELYDNDWQPGKADYRLWSMQHEAMNYCSVQEMIFNAVPNYHYGAIIWDGAIASSVWRSRIATSTPFYYISRGQKWDFHRYEGWAQFTLWTTRPREFREFRGYTGSDHLYYETAFDVVVRAVDRPWNHDVLREFWRFGKLVPNPEGGHPWTLSEDQPEWVRKLERWYHLTSDANPPQSTWGDGPTVLRVFTQALLLGEAPARRWLIYSHAPLGAVPNVTVTIPGYAANDGTVTLPSVPKSGSFFLLTEANRSLEPLIIGGPNELSLAADRKYTGPGESFRFEAKVAHAPGKQFDGFTWNFGDGHAITQETLASVEHAYAEPGTYVVTVEGRLTDGSVLREQTAAFVGETPAPSVVYDLPLNQAFTWEGPWDNWVDKRYDTLAQMRFRRQDLAWQIELPNGDYSVKVVAGDPTEHGNYRMAVNAQDELIVESNFSKNHWAEATAVVTVADGHLTLAAAGDAERAVLCFVEITPVGDEPETGTIKINFQPATSPPCPGYLVDSGDAFGDRGNGLVYGWNEQNSLLHERRADMSGGPARRLLTFRHLPNRGSLPSPVLVGGTFVDDAERGQVLELAGGEHDGVYMVRARQTNLAQEGFANKTIAFAFKPAHLDGRQVLYAEGTHHVGINLYLDGDTLYAGAFAPVDGRQFSWGPVYGRNWPGEWLKQEGIKIGTWYDVALVFTDADDKVEPDKMHLYVNGTRIASAPAARVPQTPMPPRLGRSHLRGMRDLLTQFHDGETKAEGGIRPFSGRLCQFRLINAGDSREEDEE